MPRIPLARTADELASTRDSSQWPRPPSHGGRTAFLIPGFFVGDWTLSPMAEWLRGGGFDTRLSGMWWNVACMEETLVRLEQRLQAAVHNSGRPAVVIGQSRGGLMGRALTARRPYLVDALATLGSPVRNQLAVHGPHWIPIGVLAGLGSLGVPGFIRLGCVRGDCCERARADLAAPFPQGVEYLAVFSRSDEVVRWEACVECGATPIEVTSTHNGMGVNREVWQRLSEEL